MTTKNIQDVVAEMVEEFAIHFLKRKYETTMDSDEFEYLIETQQDWLRQALTQVHQAGIDEAVRMLHRLYDEHYHHRKERDGSTTYITEKDFDNIIKALQDKK